ncbi:polysaccharide biosynthesis/export family protein [Amylibacter sp.]|nr:polysaccharide biosynthesis/export family protein [Amylibacter sp.]MDB4095662.1 polysaccharide biosynthesis/export family protein [Amylibacter sp.]
MTKIKFIAYSIILALFLQSCSKILEPVSLFGDKQDLTKLAEQEEFKINIKSLTFETAKKANNAPYPRQLILTGSGSKANVINEADFLKSSFPKSSSSSNYLLGVGDQISYIQLNEFETKIVQLPTISKVSEYLLGAGDELIFAQSNDKTQNVSVTYNSEGQIIPAKESDALTLTQGTIGSNGNILLFGLGNILAANRTLDDVRTEIRNILIRNGLAPNFQLEISEFNSKKAFLTMSDDNSKIIFINNIPITLKQVALEANLSKSYKNFALILLTRDTKEYRMTADQLFDPDTKEIIIQDNDQIEIKSLKNDQIEIKSLVGSKGNILLPGIGTISAINRTIDEIHEEISSILVDNGQKPIFQLELEKSASQKAYLIQKNIDNIIVPLTNSNTTLRQLLLKSKISQASTSNLSVITLKRNGEIYRMTTDQVLDPKTPNIFIANEDQVEIENLAYKLGQVYALSGSGNAKIITINPSKRETLADILFTENGAFNNLLAKRSEVYLLRGKNRSTAFHLDAQNVSRILVAAKTELRPNDIVYVAERPIISFSRTLAEILPLRALLKDINEGNIP